MTVALAAKSVSAVAAFKRFVGTFIKTFRVKRKRNFPYNKNDDSAGAKAPGEKSRNKNQGRKHHHMVPVENAAGGAAAVFHEPHPERAPEKHANKVANVKSHREKKKNVAVDYSGKIKCANRSTKNTPRKSYFYGVAVAFFYVFHKVLYVADVFDFGGNKIFKAEFC